MKLCQGEKCRLYHPDELKFAAKHIAFEVQHFRSYSKLKDDAALSASCPAGRQAVGYSCLLHLRVLIDFFFGQPKHDPKHWDDCHVAHFGVLSDFVKKFPPSIHERSKDTHEVIVYLNKLLAHFTATRWEKEKPTWAYYDKYCPIIMELCEKFENALSPDIKAAYDDGYRQWIGHAPVVNRNFVARIPTA